MENPEKVVALPDIQNEVSMHLDPPVKVVVRIRPVNDHEKEDFETVRKLSSDSLCVGDRKFTYDSVLDSKSNQEDIFQLVGVPSVKSALAGYNTSILSYGQTGSGKTYTMWGPPSAMVEDPSPSSQQGIVPRIFQMLFSEIQREQENLDEKQVNYQCRCSFLEIYNEQIGDLLDPTQRNLQIRDDAKNGFYVENLTEEYVTSYEDVTQILIKGLSNRKVGATSINSKSSRSHIVFTCIIESWCKGTSSKCFSSSRTSRISLVDLAGMERNKLDDSNRQCVREGKDVRKSLSQLGYLVNILAKGTHSGEIPYKSSCLTHLLRESLGGNAKLTVICAISPDNRSNGETLSTLRFGQRAKTIRNEPVINEITEDDVNDLSDQIRQLKEELIRAKSNVSHSVGSNSGCFKGPNVRDSLNQLRISLNRSLILPRIDYDPEEDIQVDEDDVKELCLQLDNYQKSCEGNSREPDEKIDCIKFSSVAESCETDVSEHYMSCAEDSEIEESSMKTCQMELSQDSVATVLSTLNLSRTVDAALRSSISINSCRDSSALHEPTLSESPKIKNAQRKSMVISSKFSTSQNNVSESFNLSPETLRQSLKRNDNIRSSLQSRKGCPGPTQSLAASLQRGLQIIDNHQRSSESVKSSVAFSFEHLALKACPEVDKEYASIQTIPEDGPSLDGPSASILCASCRRAAYSGSDELHDSLKAWIVAVDEAGHSNRLADQLPKVEGKDLPDATKREELEILCKEQAAKIAQLNSLVEQYKHEIEHNSSIKHTYESNTLPLEAPKNEIITMEEPNNEDYHSLTGGSKLLNYDYGENHQPEIVKEQCEIKEVQEVSDHEYRKTSFDLNEREALLKEIESLRNKLPSYSDASSINKSTDRLRSSLLLSRSIHLRKSGVTSQDNSEEELERERQRWTEMESDWISLTDDLRIDLEAYRRRAEKVEMELKLEKSCTEELNDVLQRAVLGHARMVEHYADLQEKHNELVEKHRMIMAGIAEVKKAAAKAGAKGHGSRFAKYMAAELSALRVEKEKEREFLKKENKSLRAQLRETAEAVHAAGELLVRLREAEEAAHVSEANFMNIHQENEKMKKQMEKLKRKHKMEMATMKQYLAESRLPESALQSLYKEDSDMDAAHNNTSPFQDDDDDQAWRAEFGAIYQDHHY